MKIYDNKYNISSQKLQLNKEECINKENGKQACQLWDHREFNFTLAKVIAQKHNKVDDHIQYMFSIHKDCYIKS